MLSVADGALACRDILRLDPLLHRRAIGKLFSAELFPHACLLVGRHEAVGQVVGNGVGTAEGVARQRQPFTHAAGAARQEVAAAHVGEQADDGLGHGHLGALGDDARRAALADAHAAAHDDAVHEGDVGLAELVNQVVERVFLGEEVFELGVAGAACLVQKANVAARAERAKGTFTAIAADRHGQHLVVVLPCQQRGKQIAHHTQRERVERLGAVQCDETDLTTHLGQNFRRHLRHSFSPSLRDRPRQPVNKTSESRKS
ncbi:hypothetical protein SDC9_134504 [bioreactor metagenome]|uniref:Uncharacterized protein n=1 Tax=bioreactor metagenome TaxID=1076179 RepID=A0A645DEE2_9ZZZZ